MADLGKKLAEVGIEAYLRGYEAGFQIGREAERKFVLHQAQKAAVENDIGEYVYLKDLEDYLRIEDEALGQSKN